jgi:hypothetical protein
VASIRANTSTASSSRPASASASAHQKLQIVKAAGRGAEVVGVA